MFEQSGRSTWYRGGFGVLIGCVAVWACGTDGEQTVDRNQRGDVTVGAGGNANEVPGLGQAGSIGLEAPPGEGERPTGTFADFPEAPILDFAGELPLPSNAPDLFEEAPPADDAGPCVAEPPNGALFPRNWLEPRIRVAPADGQNIFEIRLSVDNQKNDLVVYTTRTEWIMPRDMWKKLAEHSFAGPVDISVRAANLQGGSIGPVSASASTFDIAPATAAGTIVYWSVGEDGSGLKGFEVGDDNVVGVLKGRDVQAPSPEYPSTDTLYCIGCHTSTPDGKFAAFTSNNWDQDYGAGIASVEEGQTGTTPDFLTPTAASLIAGNAGPPGVRGAMDFSLAHWSDGDRIMISQVGDGDAELLWFNLEATSTAEGTAWGKLERVGDERGAGVPTWSHDGERIVYASSGGSNDGTPRVSRTGSDLYSIPYANGEGGVASPLIGAVDQELIEYYPSFSSDDRLIAFNATSPTALPFPGTGVCEGDQGCMYDSMGAEVFVIPSDGGEAVRVAANDPTMCNDATSPGVANSWPKWSPDVETIAGKRYYWLMFSSRRGGLPQLYATAVVEAEDGQITTYPALYLWNQPLDEGNHTPAWDVFKVPEVPPRVH